MKVFRLLLEMIELDFTSYESVVFLMVSVFGYRFVGLVIMY